MRFYKPGQTQYQSQFAPLDLNFIQKIGAAKDAESYAVDDMLDKADQLQIEAGMFSKKDEVDKYNQWLKSNVATTRDKLLNQEITEQEAARNISKINSVLANSDAVKFFNADKKLSEQLRANMASGKYNQGLSTNFNYLDPNNPQITTMSYKEGLDALARAGNIQTPTSMYDKENYASQFNDLKASVAGTSFAGNPKLDFSTGVPLIMSTDGKSVDTELTRKMVEEIGLKMAPQELRNSATPWVQYNKIKYGNNYNEQQFAKDFADAYTGYYKSSIKDFDKKFSQVSGSGSGNKDKQEGRIPARPASQNEAEVGFSPSSFYNMKASTSPNMIGGLGTTVAPGAVKKEALQVYELPSNMQEVVKDYIKDNPKWKKVAEDPNKKYSGLDKLYEEIEKSGILDSHKKQQIKSQSTMTYIKPGDKDWENLFRGGNSTNTLDGMTNTPLDTEWYDVQSGKKFTIPQLIENASEGGKTRINGIGEYGAENNMNYFLPKKLDGSRPVSINIDGKEYVAQSPYTPEIEDRQVQSIYKTIFETKTENLKKGTPIDFTIPTSQGNYKIDGVRVKYDKKEENYQLLDSSGNPIKVLEQGGQEIEVKFPNATETYNYLLTNFIK